MGRYLGRTWAGRGKNCELSHLSIVVYDSSSSSVSTTDVSTTDATVRFIFLDLFYGQGSVHVEYERMDREI